MPQEETKMRKKKAKKVQLVATAQKRQRFPDTQPDYTRECIVCGATPVVGELDMCGPCTFGESDTADGNW